VDLISLRKAEIVEIAAKVLTRALVRILRSEPKVALPVFCGYLAY